MQIAAEYYGIYINILKFAKIIFAPTWKDSELRLYGSMCTYTFHYIASPFLFLVYIGALGDRCSSFG